jgi:hypothetical protein
MKRDGVSTGTADGGAGGAIPLEFVDERHFGLVARHRDTDAVFIVDKVGARPLLCGPSLLRLLQVLPEDGEFPIETAAAVMLLVRSAREPMSMGQLRFDATTGAYQWDDRRRQDTGVLDVHGDGLAVGGLAPTKAWADAVERRLFSPSVAGDLRPRLEHLVDVRRDVLQPVDVDDVDDDALAVGMGHLEEMTKVLLADEVASALEARDAWLVADPIERPRVPKDVEVQRKGGLLIEQAERDTFTGRLGAARMNAKLASIYWPNNPRIHRIVAFLAASAT